MSSKPQDGKPATLRIATAAAMCAALCAAIQPACAKEFVLSKQEKAAELARVAPVLPELHGANPQGEVSDGPRLLTYHTMVPLQWKGNAIVSGRVSVVEDRYEDYIVAVTRSLVFNRDGSVDLLDPTDRMLTRTTQRQTANP